MLSATPRFTLPPACAKTSPHGPAPYFAITAAGLKSVVPVVAAFQSPFVSMAIFFPSAVSISIIATAAAPPSMFFASRRISFLPFTSSAFTSAFVGELQSGFSAAALPLMNAFAPLSTDTESVADFTSPASVNSCVSVTCSFGFAFFESQIHCGSARAVSDAPRNAAIAAMRVKVGRFMCCGKSPVRAFAWWVL